ncbi:ABC transporter ATP-binding protein [Corticicoccus populi]|uniref:ABC transporter ATP-binding protein n=1 Tax=Corticicoccus populi TaxID=1812821 RepID=A0ABW5WT23_9STAP
MTQTILEVNSLKKHFDIPNKIPLFPSNQSVKAVDGISFDVYKGETLGIVGESGCGKSTVARMISQIISPSDGDIKFNKQNIVELHRNELKQLRKSIQMVFQDPYSTLNPRKKIGELIEEPLVVHKIGTKKERKEKVEELLETVGINKRFYDRYPHEFSGGQRQRINIARALALNPDIIVCDEPVSALDVSIQAQVLNLLRSLQQEFNLTYIFISHDLNVVRYICDRIAVMYLGKIVEIGTYEEIYETPKHPYTKALLASIPKESPFDDIDRIPLKGNIPSPINPPSGCSFHERCPFAIEQCTKDIPELLSNEGNNHLAACHVVNNKEENK